MTDLVVINGQNVSFEVVGDQTYTTSLDIAAVFEKRHDNIIAKIETFPKDSFTDLNFKASEYTDSTGRKLKAYNITRDGFVMLVMGFTGEKAYRFKIDYINAFNKMEQILKDEKIQQIKQNQLTLKPQDGLVTPELIKALAEKGYILIDENDMKAIGEKIASSVSDGLFQILGPTRPHCLSQLNTFVYYSFWNIFLRRLRFAQSGSGFHPKWHFAQTQAPKIELRRADNCYSPIYNKWVIEDGVQDERWEWELRYKH